MMYKTNNSCAAVFDLDGTLLDTAGDIAAVCNCVLGENGFPTHTKEQYHRFLGRGAKHLIASALPPGVEDMERERVQREYQKRYREASMAQTGPYPGIVELLEWLKRQGVVTAVLSNKPHDATPSMVEHYLPGLIDRAYGHRPGRPLKPDPTPLLELLEQLGITKDRCLYVGDTEIDARTAANAGVSFVGVSWGFRTKNEISVDKPQRIVDKVDELREIIVDFLGAKG